MSDRSIAARWRTVQRARRTALIPYLTAGYPSPASTVDALRMLEAEGADFVELGIPFSDPVADGPVIQRSSHEALRAGMTVAGALDLVAQADLGIPVVGFSYVNPLLAYGLPRFLTDARAAGVAGILVTDLPAGADEDLERQLDDGALDHIRLVALTTPAARVGRIARRAQGFLYLIARLGVTGTPTEVSLALETCAADLRAVSPVPLAVGFGISSGERAAQVAAFADGVVVGSALVQKLGEGVAEARQFIRGLRHALDAVPVA